MSVDVAVIIVNFNAGEHLRASVESAVADLRDVTSTILVVDNASTDGSERGVDAMAGVRLLRNATNRGFGAAVNQAVTATDARLLWLLNPDARVVPGAFALLAATLEQYPQCAVAAPRLLNADGTVQASARGEPSALTGLFGRHGVLTRLFPRSRVARRNLPAADLVKSDIASAPVDWVMGASMLILRDRFNAVEGSTSVTSCSLGGRDLCRRLRRAGSRHATFLARRFCTLAR